MNRLYSGFKSSGTDFGSFFYHIYNVTRFSLQAKSVDIKDRGDKRFFSGIAFWALNGSGQLTIRQNSDYIAYTVPSFGVVKFSNTDIDNIEIRQLVNDTHGDSLNVAKVFSIYGMLHDTATGNSGIEFIQDIKYVSPNLLLFDLDLGTARNNSLIALKTVELFVSHVDAGATFTIRGDTAGYGLLYMDQNDLKDGTRIDTYFNSLDITNSAQIGKRLKLLIRFLNLGVVY